MAGRYTTYNTGGSNMSGVTENYQSASQNIGTNIQKITQNVVSMNKMVQQLGTSQDSGTLRAQLLQIQQYTNQLAKDTNRQLRELSAPKLVKDKLTNEFSEALHNFQLVQRAEAEKEKDSVKRARAASGLSFEPQRGGRGNLIELTSPQQPEPPSLQPQTQSYAMMDEQVDLEMLREREQAISKLESDIQDVNTIFKDLATMVHDQGDMIDSIEANVESAAVHVDEGVQQVAKAKQHQEKARKKMFCLFIIAGIVLATLITIIVVSTR